ncbi:unnamed protein product [Moneuplotes crassus]|uniref:Uncharacterized protein n=1 Tax=Euplotes crassus TaxID=5936 RepID=A0AAD2D794_EUPCR|nr:unnamed protein product [Moneuplotes crassus]
MCIIDLHKSCQIVLQQIVHNALLPRLSNVSKNDGNSCLKPHSTQDRHQS